MMSGCNNEFCYLHLRLACFCVQAVQIVECSSVKCVPWALNIAYVCHCGLEMIVFL